MVPAIAREPVRSAPWRKPRRAQRPTRRRGPSEEPSERCVAGRCRSWCSFRADVEAGLVDEDQAELVVRDLAGVADEEARRDEALGSCELAFSALDFADDSAMPQVPVRTADEPPAFDAAVAHDVPAAERDRPGFMERRARVVEHELGVEYCLAAGDLLERAANTFRTDGGDERRARRGQPDAQGAGSGRGCAPAELKRVRDRLHHDRDSGTWVMALAPGNSLTITDDWG